MPEDVQQTVYGQLDDSMRLLAELTSRIDERVKGVADKIIDQDKKMDKVLDSYFELATRVSVLEVKNNSLLKKDVEEMCAHVHRLEVKMAALEIYSVRHENKWGMMIDFGIKLLWTIVAVAVIAKLGFTTLPLPPLP